MEYESYLDRSGGKVGAMVRHMSGDVALAFQEKLRELYKNEDGVLDEVGEVCCKWHWTIVKYATNPYEMRKYVSVIQTAYRRGKNLEKVESWKALLRIILPEQFLNKMNGIATQVPKIAVMDDSHAKKEKKGDIRKSSDVLW